jgi:hypothetical protein
VVGKGLDSRADFTLRCGIYAQLRGGRGASRMVATFFCKNAVKNRYPIVFILKNGMNRNSPPGKKRRSYGHLRHWSGYCPQRYPQALWAKSSFPLADMGLAPSLKVSGNTAARFR